jgi:hypothetical protein
MRTVHRHSRPLAAALLAFALLGALAGGLTACGSDEEARQTLDRAFSTPIGSADVALDAGVVLRGGRQSGQPMRLQARGPYRSGGGRQIPSGSLDVNVAAQGQSVAARLISTGSNAWVVFMGQPYELGEQTVSRANQQVAAGQSQRQQRSLRAFGIDPRAWLKDPSIEGDETVAGAETTHISARVDLPRLLDDLNRVAQRASGQTGAPVPSQLPPAQRDRIERVVQNPKFDVFVGKDNKIRRLSTVLDLEVSDEDRRALNGLESGKITFSIEFSNVGHPGPIVPPKSARPIKDLTSQLARLVGGAGAGGAGGGAAPGAGLPAPNSGR